MRIFSVSQSGIVGFLMYILGRLPKFRVHPTSHLRGEGKSQSEKPQLTYYIIVSICLTRITQNGVHKV